MLIELDPVKVAKHFGKLPERGKLMKMFATSTVNAGMKVKNLVIIHKGKVVGRKWVDSPLGDEHPKRNLGFNTGEQVSYQWVPNPMQAWPVLALKRRGGNQWEIVCQPEFLQQSVKWLQTNCTFQKAPPHRKRGRSFHINQR